MGHDSSRRKMSKLVTWSDEPAHAGAVCKKNHEDQNLARDVNTKTPAKSGVQLSLLQQPRGTFRLALATPTTHGLWGYGDTLEAYLSQCPTGCLGPLSQFSDKARFVSKMHVSFLVTLAS